jgi:predicted acetyltransferase
LDLDLARTLVWWRMPVADPIWHRLANPRHIEVSELNDDLWLCFVDIATGLAARRYMVAERLVLDVEHPFLVDESGRYALDGSPDGATCTRTTSDADLSLGAVELAMVFLGDVRFSDLAAAGRVVEHTAGALRRADLMFSTTRLPWMGTGF